MPFRHVAMFRWADHVDDDHVHRVRQAFDELAGLVPGLRHLAHGTDAGVSVGTFDYHVVADFDTPAAWRAYRDHPAHVLLVEELINGHVAGQAAGQFQLLDATVDLAPADESDDELLARARRAAMAEMEALLTEPDEP